MGSKLGTIIAPKIERGTEFKAGQIAAPELPAQAGALSTEMQDIARSYLGARRQSGMSLLDAARWLSEAKDAAKHGEWAIFLEAIGLDESRARAQIRIHEEAQRNPIFADRIINGFLSETVARELLPLPAETREELLARETPPSRSEIRDAKRVPAPVLEMPAEPAPAPDLADMILRIDAHGYAKSGTRQKGSTIYYSFRDYKSDLDDGDAGEIELAEGELPYWLAELDDNTARANERQARYLDAQQRFAALGWDLRRNDKQFTLSMPSGVHYATTPNLEPQIKTLETFEAGAKRTAIEAAVTMPDEVAAVIAEPRTENREPERGSAWHKEQQIADQRWLEDAEMAIGSGAYAYAGQLLDRVQVKTMARDALREKIPAATPDPRDKAIRLYAQLAPLLPQIKTEDFEALSMAIANLYECQEGTEGQHVNGVLRAYLDLDED